MLEIEIPGGEFYDEVNNEFIELKSKTIQLEHSLISISKWESKWKKPFFEKGSFDSENFLDYILCMCVTKNVTLIDIGMLTKESLDKISDYMQEERTATWFRDSGSPSHEIITSEVLYYQMFSLGIPIDCEKWHISRLLTLIRVFAAKNPNAKQKMGRRDIMAQNHALNEARKKKYKTRG